MPLSQEAREVYDLRSIMSPEYSRGILLILDSHPGLAEIVVPYMHWGRGEGGGGEGYATPKF